MRFPKEDDDLFRILKNKENLYYLDATVVVTTNQMMDNVQVRDVTL